jgi:uncharacterized Fe-S radical SAM superfamily protein PflX
VNSNKAAGFFNINTAQYTTYYKVDCALSILPIHALFNSNKYKTKKPIPLANMYISVERFLDDVEIDNNRLATRFLITVDNISFLRRAPTSPSMASGAS